MVNHVIYLSCSTVRMYEGKLKNMPCTLLPVDVQAGTYKILKISFESSMYVVS